MSKKNRPGHLFALCLLLTCSSGLLRGWMDQRFGVPEKLQRAASRLAKTPTQFGEWKLVGEDNTFGSLAPASAKMLRCTGNWVAQFQHQSTGQTVQAVFLVGPAGPLAQHTPEVCYASSNYRVTGGPQAIQIQDARGETHPFCFVSAQENRPGGKSIRVYYAWNRDGKWQAPQVPRTAFAGAAMLFKIQVSAVHTAPSQTNGPHVDAGERFLQDVLPSLQSICMDPSVADVLGDEKTHHADAKSPRAPP